MGTKTHSFAILGDQVGMVDVIIGQMQCYGQSGPDLARPK